MAVVISEFEVIAAEPDEESSAEEAAPAPSRSGPRLAPREVVRILEREERRRLRVRAH